MNIKDVYEVQVIATLEELRQIGIPEDAGIQNQYMKAWDLGIKWLRFLDKQEVLLNDLIKQSNETSRN